MALANIRERLALYYDLEARLETREVASPTVGENTVLISVLPGRQIMSESCRPCCQG